MQCSHFWGRGRQTTRFDPENCDTLCYGCHAFWEANKQGEYTRFKQRQLGQARYALLEIRAHQPGKPDRKLIKLWLQRMLQQMDQAEQVFGRKA